MHQQGDPVLGLVVPLVALVLYCLPALIAYYRVHHQSTAITVANLLFGWTVLGWALCLVWAVTAVKHESSPMVVYEKERTRC